MKNNPLISVLMPVYNCAEYVQDAINSILEQTHKNIELIVIDDGSNDQTRDKVKEIKDIDSRIILLEKEHGGIASCLNDGLEIASGEYIARMDGDDISLPLRFEKQLSFLLSNPTIDIVGCWIELFGAKSGIWHYRTYDNFIKNMFLLRTNGLGHNAIMAKAETYKRFRYDAYYCDVEDTELWVRMSTSKEGVTFYNLREVLVLYRVHDTQVSFLRKERQRKLYDEITSHYFDKLGIPSVQQDSDAHMWLSDISDGLNITQLMRVSKWLNDLHVIKSNSLPDDYGVFFERWHHLCVRNNASPDIYFSFKPPLQVNWLPKKEEYLS